MIEHQNIIEQVNNLQRVVVLRQKEKMLKLGNNIKNYITEMKDKI